MSKTEKTLELEKAIWNATNKQGVFGCFEVTIGWFGKERVDYITYDTNGIWRCYEIKVSKADFYSKAHNTFCGHFNYYVMPRELYEEVKDDIPKHVGVYTGEFLARRPKKQELGVEEQTLKNSLIRSLAREFQSKIQNNNPDLIKKYKNDIAKLEREKLEYHNRYIELRNSIPSEVYREMRKAL